MPDAAELPLHVLKLILDGLQLLALLGGHAVHLLVHDLHEGADIGVGEDVGANLADDHLLEAAGVEPGSLAGVLAVLHDGLADVVGELAALGVLTAERSVARLALDQTAEQVGAPHPAGVNDLWGSGPHQPHDAPEPGLGDDGGERLLHPDRVVLALARNAPDQGARVDLVAEDAVDGVLGPALARRAGYALAVEGLGDLQHPRTGLGHVEDVVDDVGSIGVGFEDGALLRTVLHHHPVVAVGGPAGDPEAAGGGLPHTSGDLLGQDIGYPIRTTELGTHGQSSSKSVDRQHPEEGKPSVGAAVLVRGPSSLL